MLTDRNGSENKHLQQPLQTNTPDSPSSIATVGSIVAYLYSSLATSQAPRFRPPFDFLLVPTAGHHPPVWSWQRIAHWLLVGIRRHIHVLRWRQRLPREASWVVGVHGRRKWGVHLGLANLGLAHRVLLLLLLLLLGRRRRRLILRALL